MDGLELLCVSNHCSVKRISEAIRPSSLTNQYSDDICAAYRSSSGPQDVNDVKPHYESIYVLEGFSNLSPEVRPKTYCSLNICCTLILVRTGGTIGRLRTNYETHYYKMKMAAVEASVRSGNEMLWKHTVYSPCICDLESSTRNME